MNEANLINVSSGDILKELARRYPVALVVGGIAINGELTMHFNGSPVQCLGMCSILEGFIHKTQNQRATDAAVPTLQKTN